MKKKKRWTDGIKEEAVHLSSQRQDEHGCTAVQRVPGGHNVSTGHQCILLRQRPCWQILAPIPVTVASVT